MRSVLLVILISLAACATAQPTCPSAERPDAKTQERAGSHESATMTSVSIEAEHGGEFTKAQENAMSSAVRSCWESVRKPDSAGVLYVELLRFERDGSFSLGGENWAVARIFGDRFFGGPDYPVGNALGECTHAWIKTQRFPKVTALRASFQLLPASR